MAHLGRILTASAALAAAPALAHAQPLTIGGVFADAHIIIQSMMAILILCIVAAVVVSVRKVTSGPHLSGGSAFLSGLRLGGPLVGCLGAAYTALMIFMGVSNVATPLPLKVIAPGLAEIALLLSLGLMAGVVAVVANWAVESRIDRAVLRT
ncbi:hypothetical protein [Phenylobacterium sp.]|uniref:hypothetical protein n=1 Tax=Phenylobacterium sp. TaxID=1871053 RepID=UPI00286AC3E4|nr:hypothetical protein [Phenylobacterium sp.]